MSYIENTDMRYLERQAIREHEKEQVPDPKTHGEAQGGRESMMKVSLKDFPSLFEEPFVTLEKPEIEVFEAYINAVHKWKGEFEKSLQKEIEKCNPYDLNMGRAKILREVLEK